MKFITNIDKEIFNSFVKKHSNGDILQASEWGEFKEINHWKSYRVGLEDNGKIVAGALLLCRKLPYINKTIVYSPRGLVADYKNKELLEEFTKHIKDFGKELKAILVKIDPMVKYQDRDPDGNIIEDGENNKWLLEAMKDLGYQHKGFSLDFSGVQARFNFRLDISKPIEEVFNNFHSKTRYNIRLAEKKGIEIVEGTKEDLKRFSEIMNVTGERNGFINRPLSYFERMYDVLVPAGQMKVFLAKYNLEKAVKEINEEIDKTTKEMLKHEKKINDTNEEKKMKANKAVEDCKARLLKLESEIKEIIALREKYPDGLVISGAIDLAFGDNAYYLYGASDNIYRNLMPNYLLQWEMIKWAKEKGAKVYDFRGVPGDFESNEHLGGLYKFKKGFGGELVEFIGEFDLVLNKPLYFIWDIVIPKFRRLRRKLKTSTLKVKTY